MPNDLLVASNAGSYMTRQTNKMQIVSHQNILGIMITEKQSDEQPATSLQVGY